MTTLRVPKFVEQANTFYPGLAEEYSALMRLAILLSPNGDEMSLKRTVLLQCQVAWLHYNSIILLLANQFKVQSLILLRTLYETVVGTLYLLQNQSLLGDFLDDAKLLLYEQCLLSGMRQDELEGMAHECEKIKKRHAKPRGGGKRWHWHDPKRIREMSEAVELGRDNVHQLFYSGASGAAHSGAEKTLSFGAGGWKQNLSRFVDRNKRESYITWFTSFQLTGFLLCKASKALELGHDEEVNAIFALITRWTERIDVVAPN